jgi:hypothetical protein
VSSPLLSCVTSEGALLPPEILHRILAQDRGLPGLTPGDYHLDVRVGEAASRAWSALQPSWRAFRTQLEKLPVDDTGTTVTREKWLLPLFRELGFGWLAAKAGQFTVEGETYPFSHGYGHVPMHLLGARVSLDKKERGLAGAARMSPHGLVQQFLNRSDAHLWGIASNGVTVRLLRDHYSLSTTAYVEFDLEEMFDGGLYSEFLLLFLLLHQSRYEAEKSADIWLEAWFKEGQKEGVAALDRLGLGARSALADLGTGFIKHPENGALRDALKHGRLGRDAYFRELLRVLYRMLFLFVAEDRQALLLPDAPADAKERFSRYYGTRRLRELAFRTRGTAHHDLWEQLRLVFDGLWEGEPALALPALGSGLFDPRQLPHLSEAKLPNVHLLAALRTLTEVTEGGRRIRVSYRNLGAQELGSVYESLLELHPALNVDAGQFELASAAGNERKTSGSYYTPVSLVECLLDTALDPVVDGAVKGKTAKEAEAALLDLKVCDPACGSGHFLVAAARRIADRLARVRTPDEEPSPAQRQHALRDVVGHCLFGVDVNPMAVELCKVSLWMEAIEPGRPLSFLDAHIQCGNALLGATPALLARGIPEDAFEPLEGDDEQVASALKKQNRKERAELTLEFAAAPASTYVRLGEGARAVDGAADDNLGAIRLKQQRWEELVASSGYHTARFLSDLWCAAFVWRKEAGALRDLAPSEAKYRAIARDPTRAAAQVRDEVVRLRDEYRFFHWHLAFPQVLRPRSGALTDAEPCGWDGGFDVVIGNPPWDQLQFDPQEFFGATRPDIAGAAHMAARTRAIRNLEHDDPRLFAAYTNAVRRSAGEQAMVHSSGRYPLASHGRLNSAPLFTELAVALKASTGAAGLVVPTGIATDSFTQGFFRHLVDSGTIRSLFAFENEERLFSGVHHSMKFCLLTLGSVRTETKATFVFFARKVSDVSDPIRTIELSAEDFAVLNPNTRTCPVFRYRRDADIVRAIHKRLPVLARDDGGDEGAWPFVSLIMFMMNTDSGLFRTRAQLVEEGFSPVELLLRRDDTAYVPLYEAKMVHQFDHRYGTYDGQTSAQANMGTLPRVTDQQHNDPYFVPESHYWVPFDEMQRRLASKWDRNWLLGWRDVTRNTDRRTLIPAIVPRVAVGDKLLLILPKTTARMAACLYASLASFVLDYVVRQKHGGTSLKFFPVRQLPVPPPGAFEARVPWSTGTWLDFIADRVLELTYTSWDLKSFAADCDYHGGPFEWSPVRRTLLRAESDAALFMIYGLARDDVAYVMDTFPVVRRQAEDQFGEYRTKRVILECYDAMAEAAAKGMTYQTRLDPQPADPSVAHGDLQGPPRPARTPARPAPLASTPDLAWVRPRTEPRYETMAAIAAVLKLSPGSVPARNVRLAATFVLEPRWLLSHVEPVAAHDWSRLVGPEADPLPEGVRALIPATDSSWGAALKQLRGSGRLVEDTAADTWAAGSGLDGIDTAGWPDGRARYVLDVLQRIGVDAIVATLPAELKRSLDASAA